MKVTDLETDLDWMWSKEKFNNRRYVMQEMFENYKEGDKWQLPEVRTNSFKPEKNGGTLQQKHNFCVCATSHLMLYTS